MLSGIGRAKRNRSLLIFTHRQSDPDALCSAYAICHLVSKGQISDEDASTVTRVCRIITPQGASTLASSIAKTLSIQYDEKISEDVIEKADLIFCVDVGDNQLLEPYLGSIARSSATKFLVDHHSLGSDLGREAKLSLFDDCLIDSKATSTCEMIALGTREKLLDERLSKILLVGLLYDSQHLGIATEATLLAAVKLVRRGATIAEARQLLRSKPDRSEIIARLKSAQRLKYTELGRYLLAEAEVSSFQASVARMLIEIGADIGMAYGKHENEARVSLRTSHRFDQETRVDIGSLLSRLGKETGMAGGGHSGAASISGQTSLQSTRERIVAELKRALP
jgi:nanoRNase/pAp phosphatase (c-di-AMP/oligoRNAs hydrolase)